jgi:hypothetical protein
MTTTPAPDSTRLTPTDWLMRVLAFAAIMLSAFSTPAKPAVELDASWRMVLGYLFHHGTQFGTSAVFTYGPLGYIMGNTYWGGQWGGLIFWQAALAVCSSALVCWYAFRLRGYARAWALLFFAIWGLSYQDAAQQIILALAGLALVRRAGESWRWLDLALLALMTLLALVKFTNLLLAVALVALASGLAAWETRRLRALLPLAVFSGLFLLGWMLCGQNPAHLPAYAANSWQISQGYQDAMGLPCAPAEFRAGLLVLFLTTGYVFLTWVTAENRRRAAGLCLGVGAFIFLNWKHGFMRADGHRLGFYYGVLTVVVLAPLLLDHNRRCQMLKRALLIVLGLGSLLACENVLPGVVLTGLGGAQAKLNHNIGFLLQPGRARLDYDGRLAALAQAHDLRRVKTIVKDDTIDVLGYEQAVALVNGLNYAPRPVFQGYSAYTPALAQLNFDHLASDRAPDYVLFKLQTLDGRLGAMDDPEVLRLLPYRYHYVASDQGYTLWRKNPGPFDPSASAPRLLRTIRLTLGEVCDLGDLRQHNLWVEIDYDYSLLGRLRRFFLRPAEVKLRLEDTQGAVHLNRLPRPIGQGGFLLNPVIDDTMDYLRAFGGTPRARVKSLALTVAPSQRACLRDHVTVRLYEVPPSKAGAPYFRDENANLFSMFPDAPQSYHAFLAPNEDTISGQRVMVMHAPSVMTFDIPPGAREIIGAFGFVAGAYTNGGKTNGADFSVVWTSGQESKVIFERMLDPAHRTNDRGLQTFRAPLPQATGRIELRVDPGPFNINAFDWTGWTGIQFK